MGNAAFGNCPKLMGTVKIPDGISVIGANMFQGCQNIEGIIIPKMLKAFAKVPF